jgi:RND superfamily putative drug exporter
VNHSNPLIWLTDQSADRRWRWLVIAIWIVAVGFLGALAPKLANLYDNKSVSSIGDQESIRAVELLSKNFPSQQGIPAIIAINNPNGLTDADFSINKLITCWLLSSDQRTLYKCPSVDDSSRPDSISSVLSIDTVPQARSQLVSANNTTATIIVGLNIPQTDNTRLEKVVSQIRDFTLKQEGANHSPDVKVTGPAGIAADFVGFFRGVDVRLLLTTVLLVLVLLLIIYRSPILAIFPLIMVGWTLQIVNGVLGFAAQGGILPINQQSTSIMDVLLFGAGTDYVIFIASRYREELRLESDHVLALQRAMRGVGEAIASSAGTVIVSLLGLTFTILGLYHELGLILAIAVALMLLAGLTLVPATLSVLGRIAFWPFTPKMLSVEEIESRDARLSSGFWGRVAGFVSQKPLVAVLASTSLLIVLVLGQIGISEDYNQLTDVRTQTDSIDGYKLLANNFGPGTLAPFNVLIQLKEGDNAYQQLVAIDKVHVAISQVANISKVTGPTRPSGTQPEYDASTLQQQFSQIPEQVKQAIRSGSGGPPSAGGQEASPFIGLYAATISTISQDNRVVKLQVTLKIDPYSIKSLDTIGPVRDAAKQAVADAKLEGVQILLDGVTPRLADTRSANMHDIFLVVPIVLLLVGLILGLLLRSVVAALYLLGAVTLNFFATMGISAFIFTRIQGDEGISYATPVYAFIFLVALGADYTIFLMSRVREEAINHGLQEGTRIALTRTGGVITSAGLILAGTFLVLVTLPLRTLSSFGAAVAIGVLLDTFIVRALLVPGIVLLLGKWNWWPSKLPQSETVSANSKVD